MSTANKAGKASGIKRAQLAKVRRYFVLSAHEKLKPQYRNQPYSLDALDALEKELRNPARDEFVFTIRNAQDIVRVEKGSVGRPRRVPSDKLMAMLEDVVPIMCQESGKLLREVSRDTLIKDLKALGIKSKKEKQLGNEQRSRPRQRANGPDK